MTSTNSSTAEIIVDLRLRAGALLPTSSAVIPAMKKHEFILDDEKYACKSTFIVDADAAIGMAIETTKSCIKVGPEDDGGMVVKVECSYKLMPVPNVEAQDDIAETHEKIIAEIDEMGAANFKVKLD